MKEDLPIWLGLLLFFSWIVYGSISLLWSPDPMKGLNAGIIAMTIGFISLPLFTFLSKNASDPLITIRKGWLICFLLTAILGIIELTTGIHWRSAEEARILGGAGIAVPHASATFGNVNDYGTIIAFIAPYLLWGILEAKNGWSKMIYLLAFLLGLLFVVVNGSRLGLLVFVLQSLCFVFLFLHRLKKRYIIGGVVLICLAAVVLFEKDLLLTMKYRMDGSIIDGISNAASQGRGMLLAAGIQMLKQTFGFGVGAGGFEEAIKNMPAFDGTYVNPHNLFVEVFAQYGIFIFAFFCFWLFSIFYATLRNKHLSIGAKRAVCVTIITLPLIGAMSSHALGYTYYWIFLSCATVISVYRSKNIINKKQIQK